MPTLSFNPAPDLTLILFDELIDPALSLAAIARRHGASVTALSLWLSRPEISDQLAHFHSIFAGRVRVLASCNTHAAIAALARILDNFNNADPALDAALAPSELARKHELAQRTAALLLRLSNYRPASPSARSPSSLDPAEHAIQADSRIEPAARPASVPPSAHRSDRPSTSSPHPSTPPAPTTIASAPRRHTPRPLAPDEQAFLDQLLGTTPPSPSSSAAQPAPATPSEPLPTPRASSPPQRPKRSTPGSPSPSPNPEPHLASVPESDLSLPILAADTSPHEHWP